MSEEYQKDKRIEELEFIRNWLIAFVVILIIVCLFLGLSSTEITNTGVTIEQCTDAIKKICE